AFSHDARDYRHSSRVHSISAFLLTLYNARRAGVVPMTRLLLGLLPCVLLALLPASLQGAAPPRVEFPGFRTAQTAITTRVGRAVVAGTVQPAYLGIQVGVSPEGKALVADIDPGSAAARAGLRPGDVLARIGSDPLAVPDDLCRILTAKAAGTAVDLVV